MRKLLIFTWLLLPVALGAYHFGPGQDRMRADRAAAAVARAEAAVESARATAQASGDEAARGAWSKVVDAYGEALELLPPGHVHEARAIRLERAKAQTFVSQLPEARRDLQALVEEMTSDAAPDAAQLADAQGALANAEYYTTWLMRLEGAPREEWEPEIEASRQNYKLIAQHAATSGDEQVASAARENLEASIRLSRMDIQELQGLPLPSQ